MIQIPERRNLLVIEYLDLIVSFAIDNIMSAQKTSWADDVDELAEPINDYIDENGIRTTTEIAINDEGKKVKVSI